MWFLQLPSLRILDVLPLSWTGETSICKPDICMVAFQSSGQLSGADRSPPNTDPCRPGWFAYVSRRSYSRLSRISHLVWGQSSQAPIHLSGGDSAGSGLSLTLRPSPAESPMQPVQLLIATDEWNMQIDRLISLGIPQIPIARSRKRYLPWAGSTLHCIFTQRHGGFAFRVRSKCHGSEQQAPIWQADGPTRGFSGSYHDRAVWGDRDRERIDRTNSMHESDSFLLGPDRTMSAASSMTSSRWHVWASVRERVIAAPFGG